MKCTFSYSSSKIVIASAKTCFPTKGIKWFETSLFWGSEQTKGQRMLHTFSLFPGNSLQAANFWTIIYKLGYLHVNQCKTTTTATTTIIFVYMLLLSYTCNHYRICAIAFIWLLCWMVAAVWTLPNSGGKAQTGLHAGNQYVPFKANWWRMLVSYVSIRGGYVMNEAAWWLNVYM